MKIRILALCIAFASLTGAHAIDEVLDLLPASNAIMTVANLTEPKMPEEPMVVQKGLLYFRTAVGGEMRSVMPGIGFGYRRSAGNGAVDISASFLGKHRANYYTWSFPKIAYFHYLSPEKERSLYVGGGMSWGGIYSGHSDHRYFYGLIPSATLGMEFLRTSNCRAFSELTVSQPAVEAVRKGPFPRPSAEFSVGIGF